ncbi:hypothetical protein [Rhizobium sp. SGZ-381]|uniref:hypothetical protein n=1 Tax=Rhizobium sp. SGZ-381 TaxID=3342800 RepID=UPI00366D72BC
MKQAFGLAAGSHTQGSSSAFITSSGFPHHFVGLDDLADGKIEGSPFLFKSAVRMWKDKAFRHCLISTGIFSRRMMIEPVREETS